LTHDLLKLVIDALQSKVLKVEVVELKMIGGSGTYYARLYLQVNSKIIAIDARPSDSIALALRTSSAIFVDSSVMEENGRILEGDTNIDEMKRRLRSTKPEQFGDFDFKK
jgi:bifunctional DNase/RNase